MVLLVLTNVYKDPSTSNKQTPIVNYFCEEWVKIGHQVIVVNNTSKFPFFYYFISTKIRRIVESKLGFILPSYKESKAIHKIINDVQLFQLPIFKLIPGAIIGNSKIKKQAKKIINIMNDQNLSPDLILGHWINPQAQLLKYLGETYKVKTSLVIHTMPKNNELKVLKSFGDGIDYFGFRNQKLKEKFIELYGIFFKKNFFLCYSGVRDFKNLVFNSFAPKDLNINKVKLTYVGQLIKRKYPISILEALNYVNLRTIFSVNFLGQGGEDARLRSYINKKNVEVRFWGHLSREAVYGMLEKSDIFVMISRDEAFGLVYLEAMLNRNIVIASRNEAFDGIILDGVNGFLCEPGNSKELADIIERIISLSPVSRHQIQERAFRTAKNMTDSKMAVEYLSHLLA